MITLSIKGYKHLLQCLVLTTPEQMALLLVHTNYSFLLIQGIQFQ